MNWRLPRIQQAIALALRGILPTCEVCHRRGVEELIANQGCVDDLSELRIHLSSYTTSLPISCDSLRTNFAQARRFAGFCSLRLLEKPADLIFLLVLCLAVAWLFRWLLHDAITGRRHLRNRAAAKSGLAFSIMAPVVALILDMAITFGECLET